MTEPNLSDNVKHALLENVFQTIGDGAVVFDRDSTIILANRWMEKKHAAMMPLVGKKCYQLYARSDRCPNCPYLRGLQTGTPQTQVVKVPAGRDRAEWLELSTYPLVDYAGRAAGAIEHVRDISKPKQLEEQLRDETTRRRVLGDQTRDGFVAFDPGGKVWEASEQYARMLGYTPDEILQLHIWDLDTQNDKERLLQMLVRAEVSPERFETRHYRKDGTPVHLEITSTGATSGGNRLIFCHCHDISKVKALEEQIRELGIRDPLTGLYNRRYVFERLTQIAAEYSRGEADFWMSILDLDNFQAVNNVHGHKAGDLTLKEFGRALQRMIRPYDLLGRFGGEEFIVVWRRATAKQIASALQRIMKALRSKDYALEGHLIRLTFSCGLAHSSEFPREGFSVEDMISLADKRQHEAKAAGGDRCVGPPA